MNVKGFNLKVIAAIFFVSFIAIFTGLIAATGNPVLVALLVGLIVGIAMLWAPNISVWMILVLGLLSGFFISLFPIFNKLPWALTLLSMLLMLPVILKFVTHKNIPVFIWIAFIFMLYSLLVSFIQWDSFSQLIAGFKRYFQMYGLMFALALLAFKFEDHKRWLKLMLIIALIQLPFALFEYFVLIGMRGGHGGAEASDVVAGTLGANLEGGSASAQMAAFLIMTMAFLVARWKEGLIDRSKTILFVVICLLPLGLGETKIVILLLPIAWLILMRDDIKKHTGRFTLQLFALLLVTTFFGFLYLGLNKSAAINMTNLDVLNQTLNYNVGKKGYGNYLLNRTTVISFWWLNQSWNDPLGLLLGHGLGSSYFSPSNAVAGNIAVQFIGYGIDLTSASSLLWDTGLLGFALFLIIFISAWVTAGRLRKKSSFADVRADATAIQACIFILAMFAFFDNALVNILSFELIYAFVLGYLGYLACKERSSITHEVPININ